MKHIHYKGLTAIQDRIAVACGTTLRPRIKAIEAEMREELGNLDGLPDDDLYAAAKRAMRYIDMQAFLNREACK